MNRAATNLGARRRCHGGNVKISIANKRSREPRNQTIPPDGWDFALRELLARSRSSCWILLRGQPEFRSENGQ
jgi:hypothetical protein